jgi:hypothetical protein
VRCLPLELEPPPKESITCSRSFGEPVTEYKPLQMAMSCYLMNAVEKMRHHRHATRSPRYSSKWISFSWIVSTPTPTLTSQRIHRTICLNCSTGQANQSSRFTGKVSSIKKPDYFGRFDSGWGDYS